MGNKFYITTTLPYINAEPHIGFALEILEADVLARFHREKGDDVFFNTGTDEHGLKVLRKADELGLSALEYCDRQVQSFIKMEKFLNLSYDNFIRTTDVGHIVAAQEFWKKCDARGDIYKKIYKVKYCVGCELEKTESELIDGKCPLHPNMEIEIIEEENYFFRFSNYQKKLLELYEKNPNFVLPNKRLNEIKRFVEGGLEDFSISRLKEKMPWGVEVPNDSNHVMYVWFDALVNYISALGWSAQEENFAQWWPGTQLAGKDNLRQQAAMWQAMLMSADIENSQQIFINGFIGVNGQKMSKSLGNVISPKELVEKFGTDGARYLLLGFGKFGEDMDVSMEKFTEKYNADLANGLGNLVSRIIKMAEKMENYPEIVGSKIRAIEDIERFLGGLEIGQALGYIWKIIKEANKYIDENKPWELAKSNLAKFDEVMQKLLIDLGFIAELLVPMMPETAEKIRESLKSRQTEILFQRIK